MGTGEAYVRINGVMVELSDIEYDFKYNQISPDYPSVWHDSSRQTSHTRDLQTISTESHRDTTPSVEDEAPQGGV